MKHKLFGGLLCAIGLVSTIICIVHPASTLLMLAVSLMLTVTGALIGKDAYLE